MRLVQVAGLFVALVAFGCEDEEGDGFTRSPAGDVADDDGAADGDDEARRPAPGGNSGRRPGLDDDDDEEEDDDDDDDRGGGHARQPQPGGGQGRAPQGGHGGQGGGQGGGQAKKPPAQGGQPGARQPQGGGNAHQPMPKPPGINQVSATKWTVTRGLADQWMKNPYAVGNVREAGAGWQIVGVRTKAGYWLGMRNGDIIMEANGHKLDTRPQLLAAYMDLKNDKLFRVTFVRNGQTMVHTYQIVEGGGGQPKKKH